jgi:tetratricopeptide (TPR) repeat protein
MQKNLRAHIAENFNSKTTDELVAIWQTHDTNEWQEVVFEIIEEILTERRCILPPVPPQIQCERLLLEAWELFDNGELDSAMLKCEQAVFIYPVSSEANDLLGNLYVEKNQYEKAYEYFRQSVILDPAQKDYWKDFLWVETILHSNFEDSLEKQQLDQALEYAYGEEPEKSLEECEKVKTRLPNIAVAYNYLGLIYQTLNRLELAIEAYDKATQLNPRFVPAWENLSQAKKYLDQEKYFRAARRSSEEIRELSEMEFVMDCVDISDQVDSDDLIPGWYYLEASAIILPGTPGFRTRPDRSGYDQLDSEFEATRIEGIILKRLMTCKLRTKDPFNLLFIAFMGIILSLPLFGLIILPLWEPINYLMYYFILFSPSWIIGLAFLVNVILSILHLKDENLNEAGCAFY